MRPCKINEYFGRITYYDEKWGKDTSFSYYFKPPEAKNIEEEYIIYDNIGVLSAVGGILGLLLGFSLKGILKALIFIMFVKKFQYFSAGISSIALNYMDQFLSGNANVQPGIPNKDQSHGKIIDVQT